MSKIKNIQISDFRIYNGKQEFSFDNAGSLSNLMVIYAPNGFGKTSFFDAVEWCYSSKIRRFETEVLEQEINRRDYSSGDKILLTNRKSYANRKSGNVTIKTSDDKQIKRTASERKATNHDFKYDYRTISAFTSDYDQRVLEKLVKTNILTQDQIDEFLRHTKPDERFSQLQNFWPEGEEALAILEKLDSYLNMLLLERQSIENKISDAEQQVKDYLNADEQIDPLNVLIEDLMRKSVTGVKIERLTTNVNAQTYKAILDTVQTFIERVRILIKNINNEILQLDSLKTELPNYLKALSLKLTIEGELNSLTLLAKSYADMTAYRASYAGMETRNGTITSSQNKLKRLIELIGSVDELYSNIRVQREIAEECRKSINNLLHDIDIYRASAHNLQSTLNDWGIQDETLNKALITWDTDLTDYRFWIAESETGSSKLNNSNRLFKEKEVTINEKITRRHLLQTTLENHNYGNLPENDLQEVIEHIKTRNDQIGLIGDIQVALKDLKKQVEQATSLQETFDKVLVWGEQYVKETDAHHCPLCATEFDNVTDLLASINQQKSGENKTTILKKQLDDASIREQDLLNQLAASNQVIDDHIRRLLDICIAEISHLQTQRDVLSSEISNVEKTVENAKRSASNSLSKLQLDFTPSLTNAEVNFDKIKTDLEARLKEIRSKSKRLENIITAKKDLISFAENNVSIMRNKVSTADNNAEIYRADSKLVEAETIIKELDLPSDSLYRSPLENRLNEMIKEQKDLIEQISLTLKNVEDIQNNIKTLPIQIIEPELPGRRVAKQDELTDNFKIITNYLNSFKVFSSIEEPTTEWLHEASLNRETNLESVKAELTGLEEIFVKLQVIEKNVTKNALEQELKQLVNQIGPLQDSAAKVKLARQTAEKYITNEINIYFNQDVINQIYSRIEPHPDLNQIRITPKITDRGPILDIKAISSEEELDPSLYLSAGQLNVLSLSIFLAKAFETRSDEIDTIFMDDPIQNLSDINILSFIDLIRTMITRYDRQIVISSHDENFYQLMRKKMPSEAFNIRYYEIKSFGKAKYVQ